jgi:hypothetical protein
VQYTFFGVFRGCCYFFPSIPSHWFCPAPQLWISRLSHVEFHELESISVVKKFSAYGDELTGVPEGRELIQTHRWQLLV